LQVHADWMHELSRRSQPGVPLVETPENIVCACCDVRAAKTGDTICRSDRTCCSIASGYRTT
jgi:hypothetical protein